MVTVLMGKSKIAPKQAHCISYLFDTLCKTPIMLIAISVTIWVAKGWNFADKPWFSGSVSSIHPFGHIRQRADCLPVSRYA